MITYDQLRHSPEIRTYIQKADESLRALGFTEHSFAHVTRVSETAAYILSELEYDAHEIELAKIAGYLHDIGKVHTFSLDERGVPRRANRVDIVDVTENSDAETDAGDEVVA